MCFVGSFKIFNSLIWLEIILLSEEREKLSTFLVREKKIAELFNLILLYSDLSKKPLKTLFFFTAGHPLSNTTQPPLCSALWLIRLYLSYENEHWLLLCTLLMNTLSLLSPLHLPPMCVPIYNAANGFSGDLRINGSAVHTGDIHKWDVCAVQTGLSIKTSWMLPPWQRAVLSNMFINRFT